MLRKLGILLLALLILVPVAMAGPKNNRDRNLTVMTRNLDTGTDFGLLMANPTPAGVTATLQEMIDSNMPERASLVAAEIQAHQPDLVGLQEISTVYFGPYDPVNPVPPTNVLLDQLAYLKANLEARGLHYNAIVQNNAVVVVVGLAESGYVALRFVDADAILIRSDLKVSELKIEKTMAQHFQAQLTLVSKCL